MKRSLTHARESAEWSNPEREALAARLHEALDAARKRTRNPRLDAVLGNRIEVVARWWRTKDGIGMERLLDFGPDEMERAIAYVEGL